ncbi:phospho-2-dehydro-3-deoxyheptonate aldolase [Klebsiella pneumoniae]|uniref:Phospho-2-dehydro-3-deoxyheptonate aldolase n=1 Tax=Klebsiella pneumoniae TaxID=573 RepID=A0A378A563_KLEPN|nr:phospho-2-dehydro-3-deoxyheptonate aldolase [Klebsiella pneumoniae]
MAESFLQEGTQKVVPGQPLTWGQSITDPCLSWEDSERLLSELAAATATACNRSARRACGGQFSSLTPLPNPVTR